MRFKDTLGISFKISQLQFEMSRQLENKLRDLNLTLAQYSTLSVLEDQKNLTNADLARSCFVTPQTMNKTLNNLEKLGYVRKGDDPLHKKKINYSLTVRAEKLICKAHVLVNETEQTMVKGFAKSKIDQTLNLLDVCLENICRST